MDAAPDSGATEPLGAGPVRTLGWRYPFNPVPWAEILQTLRPHPELEHMAAIAESVISSGSSALLGGYNSMFDLIVVPLPEPGPPYDVVAVRQPHSLHRPKPGHVLIEHMACTGRNDSIERPVAEAVPLFWRFMIEKYGVHPAGRADR